MKRADLQMLKDALCPHDEDYDNPCISPHNLEICLEQLTLEDVITYDEYIDYLESTKYNYR